MSFCTLDPKNKRIFAFINRKKKRNFCHVFQCHEQDVRLPCVAITYTKQTDKTNCLTPLTHMRCGVKTLTVTARDHLLCSIAWCPLQAAFTLNMLYVHHQYIVIKYPDFPPMSENAPPGIKILCWAFTLKFNGKIIAGSERPGSEAN